MDSITRFWTKVSIKGSDECWEWIAGKGDDGYGIFWYNGGSVRATRFLAREILGLDITDKCVCHHCDNPSCMNPNHLFVGTDSDNMKDRDEKGRVAHGERCHLSKVASEDVAEIRRLADTTNMTHREIGEMFGLSRPQTSNIIRRGCWKRIRSH